MIIKVPCVIECDYNTYIAGAVKIKNDPETSGRIDFFSVTVD